MQRLALRELLPVEPPNEALHVARQAYLNLARRPTRVFRATDGVKIRIGQLAPTVISQPWPGIIERARWVHYAHVDGGIFAPWHILHVHTGHPLHALHRDVSGH